MPKLTPDERIIVEKLYAIDQERKRLDLDEWALREQLEVVRERKSKTPHQRSHPGGGIKNG